ncbi:MAG: hypothetical protein ABI564_03460 [Ideonella sp.]
MNSPRAQNVPLSEVSKVIELPRAADEELERSLAEVEARLDKLAEALLERDLSAIELESSRLHQSLAQAVDRFTRQARRGPIPQALRRRLAHTSGHVAAQRESFARATAALDRAIDVLLPRDTPSVYGSQGVRSRSSLGGMIEA